MDAYRKPQRWQDPRNKLFPHQVGFTAPPHDFDAAPSDFLRIAPEIVGVHGRMLHAPLYAHHLKLRTQSYHLLEEFVECMANNEADVCGQVGSNRVHAGGKTPDDIRAFCERIGDSYETPSTWPACARSRTRSDGRHLPLCAGIGLFFHVAEADAIEDMCTDDP